MTSTGLKLDFPAAAALQGVQLPPGQILRVLLFHACHIDEKHGVEAPFAQDRVAPGPGVKARAVEGQQQRPWRKAHLLSLDEADELVQRDRVVARIVQQGHLPRETLRVDAQLGVRALREAADRCHTVIEEYRDHRAIGRRRRPHLPIIGTQDHSRRGRWAPRRGLVGWLLGRLPARAQRRAAAGGSDQTPMPGLRAHPVEPSAGRPPNGQSMSPSGRVPRWSEPTQSADSPRSSDAPPTPWASATDEQQPRRLRVCSPRGAAADADLDFGARRLAAAASASGPRAQPASTRAARQGLRHHLCRAIASWTPPLGSNRGRDRPQRDKRAGPGACARGAR
jgi:hypothetical protein